MAELDLASFRRLVDDHDKSAYMRSEDVDSTSLEAALKQRLGSAEHVKRRAVLGMDIFGYTRYPDFEQMLIPPAFSIIHDLTNRKFVKNEKFLSASFPDGKFPAGDFINTGDGGFQIFETPLHAVMYAMRFALYLKVFNTGHFYPRLRKAIKQDISTRFSIAYDDTFKFNGTFYGPGVIRAQRLMSRDKLDRCLCDGNTYDWFERHCNGLENLSSVPLEQIARAEAFKDISKASDLRTGFTLLDNGTDDGANADNRIKFSNVMRLGDVPVKGGKALTAFSLYLQASANLIDVKEDEDQKKRWMFTASVGSLHGAGL